jgi:hypothetical protein
VLFANRSPLIVIDEDENSTPRNTNEICVSLASPSTQIKERVRQKEAAKGRESGRKILKRRAEKFGQLKPGGRELPQWALSQ